MFLTRLRIFNYLTAAHENLKVFTSLNVLELQVPGKEKQQMRLAFKFNSCKPSE